MASITGEINRNVERLTELKAALDIHLALIETPQLVAAYNTYKATPANQLPPQSMVPAVELEYRVLADARTQARRLSKTLAQALAATERNALTISAAAAAARLAAVNATLDS